MVISCSFGSVMIIIGSNTPEAMEWSDYLITVKTDGSFELPSCVLYKSSDLSKIAKAVNKEARKHASYDIDDI